MASTTVPPAGPPAPANLAALPPVRGRASLGGAIASEWTKIRTVRSTYWTLFALAVVSIGLGAGIAAAASSELSTRPGQHLGFDATQTSLIASLEFGPLVLAVLGALIITAEYSTGMIRTSLTVQPRRATVYAAKVIVFGLVALVVSLVIAFVAFFLGQAVLGSGVSATLSHAGTIRAIVGGALYVTMTALFAFGIGAVLRHTAGSITIAIAILFVVPIVTNFLPDNWNADIVRWLPSSAAQIISTTVGPLDQPHYFAPWGQFAVTAGYAVVLLIAGAILFYKRDA